MCFEGAYILYLFIVFNRTNYTNTIYVQRDINTDTQTHVYVFINTNTYTLIYEISNLPYMSVQQSFNDQAISPRHRIKCTYTLVHVYKVRIFNLGAFTGCLI